MNTQVSLTHLHSELKQALESSGAIDEGWMQEIEKMIENRDLLIRTLADQKINGFQLSKEDRDQINRDSAEIQRLFELRLKTLSASIQGIQDEKGQLVKKKKANRTYSYIEPSTEGHFFDKKK